MKLDESNTLKVNIFYEENKYGSFYTAKVYAYKKSQVGTMMEESMVLETIGTGVARGRDLALALAYQDLYTTYKSKYYSKV